jgi:hypothetical protein
MQVATITNAFTPPLNVESNFKKAERKEEFRQGLFDFPDFIERKTHLLREIDDYGDERVRRFLDSATDLDYNNELLTIELDRMRHRFGYENANMLERILINQVLISWLKLKLFEIREAKEDGNKTNLSFILQLRQAQAQFSNAYDALLKVKKLLPEFECL